MADYSDTQTQTCAQCGAAFDGRKRKYCTQRCNWLAYGRRKGKRPRAEVDAEQRAKVMRECPECKRMFRITRHDGHSKGPQVHCSNTCRQSVEHRLARFIASEKALYQSWSIRALGATRAQLKWRCALDERAARKALLGAIIAFVVNPKRTCTICARPIGRTTAQYTYCSECANDRGKALKRAARLTDKLRRRAAIVERFDPFEVFDRDGWKCHMCGCKTPKRLRGTLDKRAPELDHIIPIAAGGEHSRLNTACSCRSCNGAKGAKPLGQMRLVA